MTVERVMTDNGSAYRSRDWRDACGGLALRHLRTRPYTRRTNGKAERFIQTSLREWAYARPFGSCPGMWCRSSRPAITHDRSAGVAPGAPQATGASRRVASLRRPAGPATLQQEVAHL
jgi:transposase InsO family protein